MLPLSHGSPRILLSRWKPIRLFPRRDTVVTMLKLSATKKHLLPSQKPRKMAAGLDLARKRNKNPKRRLMLVESSMDCGSTFFPPMGSTVILQRGTRFEFSPFWRPTPSCSTTFIPRKGWTKPPKRNLSIFCS